MRANQPARSSDKSRDLIVLIKTVSSLGFVTLLLLLLLLSLSFVSRTELEGKWWWGVFVWNFI